MREGRLPCKKGRRREQEERKRNRERRKGAAGLQIQPRKYDKEKTFGQQNQIRDVDKLGWDTWDAREKYHTHLFQLLEIIHFTP